MPGKLVEHRCRVKAGTQGMTGGFESHSWAQKEKEPDQGGQRLKTKKHYKGMKEKRFIKFSDLGEIVEALAKSAKENGDNFYLTVTFRRRNDEQIMQVCAKDIKNCQTVVHQDYTIVEYLDDADDVEDDIFTLAKGKIKLNETSNN